MNFQKYLNENTDLKQQWQKYINGNPLLKAGVEVLQIISKAGGEAWLVGGCVRDIVLGVKPHDVDICTTLMPEDVAKLFKSYDIGQGSNFGVVVIKHKAFTFEVATLRGESYIVPKTVRKIKAKELEPYDPNNPDHLNPDKYEVVEYGKTGRRPQSVSFNVTLKDDLSRRDYTLNSLAIDKDGNLIDYFDGIKAIKNKVIKAVGDPNERFAEDHLRIMRGVRFAAKLGFEIDPDTKEAMIKHKSSIALLSPERIKGELFKSADGEGGNFAKALRLLDDVGILDIILPEIKKLQTTKETPEHHPEAYADGGKGSVFDHTMKALEQNKVKDALLNIAIMLHDVGKPSTYKFVDGKHTYYDHAEKAKDIIDNLAKRLRLSNKEKDAILFAAMNHMKMFNGNAMKISKILALVNNENWPLLQAVSLADDSCRIGMFNRAQFDTVVKDMEAIAKRWGEKTVGSMVKVVDGKHVMRLTGLLAGKVLGDLIKRVTAYVLDNNIKNEKDIDALILKFRDEME